MTDRPVETTPPAKSLIQGYLPNASFQDAWAMESPPTERSALELFIAAARKTPKWVEACMKARNRAVSFFGLKNLGSLAELSSTKPASAYQPGERVGIFTLLKNTHEEVLLGDDDKHLNVVLSVHRKALVDKPAVLITVTTVVHVKNTLGRIYMLPVKPMHRIIAPAVLAKMA